MKSTVRTLVALAVRVLMPLTASADFPIFWQGDTPTTTHDGNPPDMICRYATVGQFLITTNADYEDERSFEIPKDAVSFTLFEDCSVTFHTGTPVTHEQPTDNERWSPPSAPEPPIRVRHFYDAEIRVI